MRKIGIEHEFFIQRLDGDIPSSTDLKLFFEKLKKYNFREYAPKENTTLSKDYEDGYVAINNDFCTHILEIAFPPVFDLEKSKDMFLDVFNIVEKCLSDSRLKKISDSYINIEDEKIKFVYNSRFTFFKNKKKVKTENYEQYPTAKIVSTQYDIDVLDENKTFKNLSKFYSFEYLLTYLNIDNNTCKRHLIWKESFDNSYFYNGFININVDSYKEYKNKFDSYKVARDYSYISPRSNKRIEFRGSSSLNTVDEIIFFGILRQRIMDIVESGVDIPFVSKNEFYELCMSKKANVKIIYELITFLPCELLSCSVFNLKKAV